MIRRVVILGHTGFIGTRLRELLAERSPELEVEGLAPASLDLTCESGDALAERLGPDAAVVMLSGIKRQSGDTQENFERNLAMAARVARLLRRHAFGRFIYFSSAAVYGEDVEGRGITEETAVKPTSYYGLAKFASEGLLRKACEGKSGLVILRPATIYGPRDQAGGYGPSGFVRAALRGERITLWGDGGEKREFLFIDDVCELTRRLLAHDFSGTLNVASGRSYTFQEALAVARTLGTLPEPDSRPRSKAQVDHSFDNAALRRLWPDLRFTDLAAGMRRTFEAEAALAR